MKCNTYTFRFLCLSYKMGYVFFRFRKVLVSMSDGQNLTISSWLSKRTPPHRQGHDDDWLNRNRMQPQRSVVGDSGDEGEYVVPPSTYRRTHSRGNPFDKS